MFEAKQSTAETERQKDIIALTHKDTPLEQRVALAHKLFPLERKLAMRSEAEHDSKGRPVSYFRDMDFAELQQILFQGKVAAKDNPLAEQKFEKEKAHIVSEVRRELGKQRIENREALEKELELAMGNIEDFRNFVLKRLPRETLFELHFRGMIPANLLGLFSMSVGAPMMPPVDPLSTRGNYQEGKPVVEFVIPSSRILVNPSFKERPSREMEKEVDVLALDADFIVDVYTSVQDFEERLVTNPDYPLAALWENTIAHDGQRRYSHNIWDTIQDWKRVESIADLLPTDKLADLDSYDALKNQPLLVE